MGEIRLCFDAAKTGLRETDHGLTVDLEMPVLAGEATEPFASLPGGEAFTHQGFRGFRSNTTIAAVRVIPLGGAAPEVETSDAYAALLDLSADLPLYRTWNYVPAINHEIDGLEIYRSFNLGRAAGYDAVFGAGSDVSLPAASGVGIDGDTLVIAFLGGTQDAAFFENPHQVPASRYPALHGPRPPRFARGAVVAVPDGPRRTAYLSGTASITGHETIGIGDIEKQAHVTCDNVLTMFGRMDAAPDRWTDADFRVYVRRAADLDAARDIIFTRIPQIVTRTKFLRVDICREALLLEVEGWATV